MEELRKLITDNLYRSDDRHIEYALDHEELPFEIEDDILDEWEDDGKYSFGTIVLLIKYNDNKYVASFTQTKSGSYFTDYYYSEAELYDLVTEEEYNTPKQIYEFVELGHKVIIFRDTKSGKLSHTIEVV